MREDRHPGTLSTLWKRKRVVICSFILGPLFAVGIAALVIFPLSAAAAAGRVANISSSASCAQLARVDRTATNGGYWGATILPGFGASGGWFGVPICANGTNLAAPGGANVSCDRAPSNFRSSFCAPGAPTNDGYGWSFQCVELVIRFTSWAFGAPTSSWHGDAQYLWLSGNHPASFTPYVNGGTVAPVPGDILVWGGVDSRGRPWPGSPSGGHVAVVAATGPGWITFVEENMLGAHGNIPEETTTLTQQNGHWTIGHAYANNGGRALYGWLHEAGNSGHFSGTHPSTSSAPAAPVATPTLPALTNDVFVTGAGALAQLVWSDSHTAQRPTRPSSGAAPNALPESLGAPPGVTLAPDQTPAVIALAGGGRYAFVRGEDGELYAAYTPPTTAGALAAETLWQNLGAPTGLNFTSSPAALWTGKDIALVALASDHAVWARVGPAGSLGAWVSLGKPANADGQGFQGTPALARAIGQSAQNAAQSWVALALGQDGKLYTINGQASDAAVPQSGAATGSSGAIWGSWSAANVAGMAEPLTGAPFTFSEPGDGALDVAVADTTGHLWLLRQTQAGQPWSVQETSLPDASARILAANVASDASHLRLYITDPHLSSTALASSAQETILVGDMTLTRTNTAPTVAWNVLGYLPGAAQESGNGATSEPIALDLGGGQRALLSSTGAQSQLIVDPAAANLLEPGASATPTVDAQVTRASNDPAPVTGAGSIQLGMIAPPLSFTDSFGGAALDQRWAVTSGSASSVVSASSALTLTAPSDTTSAIITQGAPNGDFTATVHLAPNPVWNASDTAQAGVTLTLDSWNAVTLNLRADGTVALCPLVAGAAQTCATVAAPQGALAGAYLRLSVANGVLRGEVSADKTNWTLVGTWKIAWLADADAALGAYAPLVAPSGAANPGGYGARPVAFTGLSLFVSGSATTGARRQASSSATAGASATFSGFNVTA